MLQSPFTFHLPLDTGHPGKGEDQQCWWLQASCVSEGRPAMDPPYPQCPPPSPGGEKKVALGMEKPKPLLV